MTTNKIYTATAAIEVQGFRAFEDASGAPATVRIADFMYAADYIGGEVRLNLIRGPQHGRTAGTVAADRARRAYAVLINEQTSESWRSANVALYADEKVTA